MRAVTVHAADGPGAISVEDRPVRDPQEGEVLLRVAAAAVNPADTFMWRTLGGGGGSIEPPFTPGLDAAGTIAAVGAGVERFEVGQEVMAVVNARRPEGGAQAELVVVPAASVVPIPAGRSLVESATLPMNGLTALEGLAMLDLAPGATLAVTGSAGVLGSYVVALAKGRGVRVIADAKPDDAALVAGFGADDVVPRGDGFVDAVRALVPDGVDAVYDAAAITRAAVPAIRDGGAIAVVRGWDDQGDPKRGIAVRAVSVGKTFSRTEWLTSLAADAAAGRLPLRVAGTCPPEEAEDAYLRMEAGGLRGRLVLTF